MVNVLFKLIKFWDISSNVYCFASGLDERSTERGGDGQNLDGVESCAAPGQRVRWGEMCWIWQWIFQLKEEMWQGTEKYKNYIEILCLTLASAAG